ncbi:transposable element Tc1 transposase [Trichonephila clavipes]|nr:transposable element Tc1 transposase [Trichonephila clavipes]
MKKPVVPKLLSDESTREEEKRKFSVFPENDGVTSIFHRKKTNKWMQCDAEILARKLTIKCKYSMKVAAIGAERTNKIIPVAIMNEMRERADEKVILVQWEFRNRYEKTAVTNKSLLRYYQQFYETDCLCKTKSSGQPSVSEEAAEQRRTSFARSPRNLQKLLTLKQLPLTPAYYRARVQWCLARPGWNNADWGCIMLSDEYHFQLCPDYYRKRVWRRPGRVHLAIIRGTLKAQRYFDDILRSVLLTLFLQYSVLIFQQDNARSHTVRATINCLKAYIKQCLCQADHQKPLQ